jgi:hypothetical protein
LDCRGHGKSDKPHRPEDYGAHMGQDVLRLLSGTRLLQSLRMKCERSELLYLGLSVLKMIGSKNSQYSKE